MNWEPGEAQAGKTYLGRNKHVEAFSNCSQCHAVHKLKVQIQACDGCHQGVKTQEDLKTIRMSTTDYDGDGDTKEGIAGKVGTFQDALYAAMQQYAAKVLKAPIVYETTEHPYSFKDTNGNGKVDPGEAVAENGHDLCPLRLPPSRKREGGRVGTCGCS